MTMAEDDARRVERARRRLKGFLIHLAGYFVVMAALVAVNLGTGGEPWFLLPLVGWGSVLALHAAYAMGLLSWLERR